VSVVASETLIRQFNQTAWMIIAVTLVLFVLFYFFSSYFLKNIIEPIHNTVEGMRRVEDGDLAVHIEPAGQAELRTMIHSFNHMTKHLGQLLQDNREQEQKKHEAELRALQSQINPHFLVNSLSSIRFIAQVSKFDSIAKMAEALMKILSCSFRSNAGFYRLREELEVLDSFLYLMKIRYSDGFEVHYEVEESCMDCLIPRLILQPIVENSIVHGFSELVDEIGQIHLSAEEEAGFLYIRIRDNGKGMSEEEIESLLSGEGHDGEDHTSIGITNVNTRLVLNYGPDCELGIESCKGEYTMTTVRLPVRRESV
ncbi:MAG: sensor histidine kinase, partial [Hungatella sp.]